MFVLDECIGRVGNGDTRTPAELLDLIEAKGKKVAGALAALRTMG